MTDDGPAIRQFSGVVNSGVASNGPWTQTWVPLYDPDGSGSWWVLSEDGASYWDSPQQVRDHAAGLAAECPTIDEIEPGLIASYQLLADLMDRLHPTQPTPNPVLHSGS